MSRLCRTSGLWPVRPAGLGIPGRENNMGQSIRHFRETERSALWLEARSRGCWAREVRLRRWPEVQSARPGALHVMGRQREPRGGFSTERHPRLLSSDPAAPAWGCRRCQGRVQVPAGNSKIPGNSCAGPPPPHLRALEFYPQKSQQLSLYGSPLSVGEKKKETCFYSAPSLGRDRNLRRGML